MGLANYVGVAVFTYCDREAIISGASPNERRICGPTAIGLKLDNEGVDIPHINHPGRDGEVGQFRPTGDKH